MAFVFQVQPKSIEECLLDVHWLLAMQEELNQLKRNEIWDLVLGMNDPQVIGTKWIFWKKKKDETSFITKNKVHLVAKG